MSIKCHFDQITADCIAGWAWDPDTPQVPVVAELFDGDKKLGTIEASQHRPDLARAQFRGGACAFWFRCAPGHRINDAEKVRGVFHLLTQPLRTVELRGQRTEDGWVDFGTYPLPTLKKLGLTLETLRGRRQLGTQTRLEPPIVIQASIAPGATLDIGAFTGIFGGSLNWCEIGRYCSIAPECVIGPREHAMDWLTTSLVAEQPRTHDWHAFIDPEQADQFHADVPAFAGKTRRAIIGNDVWLGNGVFVRAGVTIGNGAVIGARSVVVSDIPPYAVAVGNPARVKRMRFPEPIVERLQKLQWWRYSLYELMDVPFDRIEAAVDAIEARIADGKVKEYRPAPYTLQRLREALGTPAK